MNPEQTKAMEMSPGALSGELTFPDIVGRLAAIGVERYHADYSRQEITYYLPDGDSLVVAASHPAHATAIEFSSSAVAAAVRQSQLNEHTYLDFIRTTMAAGCVGYFVRSGPLRDLFRPQGGESCGAFPSSTSQLETNRHRGSRRETSRPAKPTTRFELSKYRESNGLRYFCRLIGLFPSLN